MTAPTEALRIALASCADEAEQVTLCRRICARGDRDGYAQSTILAASTWLGERTDDGFPTGSYGPYVRGLINDHLMSRGGTVSLDETHPVGEDEMVRGLYALAWTGVESAGEYGPAMIETAAEWVALALVLVNFGPGPIVADEVPPAVDLEHAAARLEKEARWHRGVATEAGGDMALTERNEAVAAALRKLARGEA